MRLMAWMRGMLGLALLLTAFSSWAGDPCPQLRQQQMDPLVATRIAAVACDEHQRWNRPFIDVDGHLASALVYEAEDRGLQDGGAPWRRVAFYWQSSGLLPQIAFRPGATDCNYAALSLSYPELGCRGFIIDNPWSAAFISWVVQRAGVPGFLSSASHFDYVRAAFKDEGKSPYRLLDPMTAALAVGDMLCYVRSPLVYGFAGLTNSLKAKKTQGLPMHCDVIVAVDGGRAYAIGGNVQQAVTMRMFNVNAQGQLWGIPRRTDADPVCSPDAVEMCNFNRQDWAAVLKLKSQQELANIGSVAPPAGLLQMPKAPTCCVNCVLGDGVPRCPADGTLPPQAESQIQGAE